MIKNVLSSIGGIGLYGIVAVLLFFITFLSVVAWSFALRRPYLDRMSRLPLEEDPAERLGAPVESDLVKHHE